MDINYRCGNLALSHTIPVHLQTKVVCGAYQVRTTGSTKKKKFELINKSAYIKKYMAARIILQFVQ